MASDQKRSRHKSLVSDDDDTDSASDTDFVKVVSDDDDDAPVITRMTRTGPMGATAGGGGGGGGGGAAAAAAAAVAVPWYDSVFRPAPPPPPTVVRSAPAVVAVAAVKSPAVVVVAVPESLPDPGRKRRIDTATEPAKRPRTDLLPLPGPPKAILKSLPRAGAAAPPAAAAAAPREPAEATTATPKKKPTPKKKAPATAAAAAAPAVAAVPKKKPVPKKKTAPKRASPKPVVAPVPAPGVLVFELSKSEIASYRLSYEALKTIDLEDIGTPVTFQHRQKVAAVAVDIDGRYWATAEKLRVLFGRVEVPVVAAAVQEVAAVEVPAVEQPGIFFQMNAGSCRFPLPEAKRPLLNGKVPAAMQKYVQVFTTSRFPLGFTDDVHDHLRAGLFRPFVVSGGPFNGMAIWAFDQVLESQKLVPKDYRKGVKTTTLNPFYSDFIKYLGVALGEYWKSSVHQKGRLQVKEELAILDTLRTEGSFGSLSDAERTTVRVLVAENFGYQLKEISKWRQPIEKRELDWKTTLDARVLLLPEFAEVRLDLLGADKPMLPPMASLGAPKMIIKGEFKELDPLKREKFTNDTQDDRVLEQSLLLGMDDGDSKTDDTVGEWRAKVNARGDIACRAIAEVFHHQSPIKERNTPVNFASFMNKVESQARDFFEVAARISRNEGITLLRNVGYIDPATAIKTLTEADIKTELPPGLGDNEIMQRVDENGQIVGGTCRLSPSRHLIWGLLSTMVIERVRVSGLQEPLEKGLDLLLLGKVNEELRGWMDFTTQEWRLAVAIRAYQARYYVECRQLGRMPAGDDDATYLFLSHLLAERSTTNPIPSDIYARMLDRKTCGDPFDPVLPPESLFIPSVAWYAAMFYVATKNSCYSLVASDIDIVRWKSLSARVRFCDPTPPSDIGAGAIVRQTAKRPQSLIADILDARALYDRVTRALDFPNENMTDIPSSRGPEALCLYMLLLIQANTALDLKDNDLVNMRYTCLGTTARHAKVRTFLSVESVTYEDRKRRIIVIPGHPPTTGADYILSPVNPHVSETHRTFADAAVRQSTEHHHMPGYASALCRQHLAASPAHARDVWLILTVATERLAKMPEIVTLGNSIHSLGTKNVFTGKGLEGIASAAQPVHLAEIHRHKELARISVKLEPGTEANAAYELLLVTDPEKAADLVKFDANAWLNPLEEAKAIEAEGEDKDEKSDFKEVGIINYDEKKKAIAKKLDELALSSMPAPAKAKAKAKLDKAMAKVLKELQKEEKQAKATTEKKKDGKRSVLSKMISVTGMLYANEPEDHIAARLSLQRQEWILRRDFWNAIPTAEAKKSIRKKDLKNAEEIGMAAMEWSVAYYACYDGSMPYINGKDDYKRGNYADHLATIKLADFTDWYYVFITGMPLPTDDIDALRHLSNETTDEAKKIAAKTILALRRSWADPSKMRARALERFEEEVDRCLDTEMTVFEHFTALLDAAMARVPSHSGPPVVQNIGPVREWLSQLRVLATEHAASRPARIAKLRLSTITKQSRLLTEATDSVMAADTLVDSWVSRGMVDAPLRLWLLTGKNFELAQSALDPLLGGLAYMHPNNVIGLANGMIKRLDRNEMTTALHVSQAIKLAVLYTSSDHYPHLSTPELETVIQLVRRTKAVATQLGGDALGAFNAMYKPEMERDTWGKLNAALVESKAADNKEIAPLVPLEMAEYDAECKAADAGLEAATKAAKEGLAEGDAGKFIDSVLKMVQVMTASRLIVRESTYATARRSMAKFKRKLNKAETDYVVEAKGDDSEKEVKVVTLMDQIPPQWHSVINDDKGSTSLDITDFKNWKDPDIEGGFSRGLWRCQNAEHVRLAVEMHVIRPRLAAKYTGKEPKLLNGELAELTSVQKAYARCVQKHMDLKEAIKEAELAIDIMRRDGVPPELTGAFEALQYPKRPVTLEVHNDLIGIDVDDDEFVAGSSSLGGLRSRLELLKSAIAILNESVFWVPPEKSQDPNPFFVREEPDAKVTFHVPSTERGDRAEPVFKKKAKDYARLLTRFRPTAGYFRPDGRAIGLFALYGGGTLAGRGRPTRENAIERSLELALHAQITHQTWILAGMYDDAVAYIIKLCSGPCQTIQSVAALANELLGFRGAENLLAKELIRDLNGYILVGRFAFMQPCVVWYLNQAAKGPMSDDPKDIDPGVLSTIKSIPPEFYNVTNVTRMMTGRFGSVDTRGLWPEAALEKASAQKHEIGYTAPVMLAAYRYLLMNLIPQAARLTRGTTKGAALPPESEAAMNKILQVHAEAEHIRSRISLLLAESLTYAYAPVDGKHLPYYANIVTQFTNIGFEFSKPSLEYEDATPDDLKEIRALFIEADCTSLTMERMCESLIERLVPPDQAADGSITSHRVEPKTAPAIIDMSVPWRKRDDTADSDSDTEVDLSNVSRKKYEKEIKREAVVYAKLKARAAAKMAAMVASIPAFIAEISPYYVPTLPAALVQTVPFLDHPMVAVPMVRVDTGALYREILPPGWGALRAAGIRKAKSKSRPRHRSGDEDDDAEGDEGEGDALEDVASGDEGGGDAPDDAPLAVDESVDIPDDAPFAVDASSDEAIPTQAYRRRPLAEEDDDDDEDAYVAAAGGGGAAAAAAGSIGRRAY